MKKIYYLLLMVVCLSGCAAKVTSATNCIDPITKPNSYIICTEDIAPPSITGQYDNAMNREIIANTIHQQMQKRKWMNVSENPRIQIGFKVNADLKQHWKINCITNKEFEAQPGCWFVITEKMEKTITLYALDIQSNEVIWEGVLAKQAKSPELFMYNLHRYTRKILNDFFKN